MNVESGVPAASVVVCTRDRAELLDGCLAGLAAAEPPDDGVEIVVVDNGSTDATAQVVERWARRGAPVRYVSEPRVGVSHARNAGVEAARARLVVYADDDVLVSPGWLRAHVAAYRRWPGAIAVGGPVHLAWPVGRPAWLTSTFERWYSAVDLGGEPRLVEPSEILVAANLSLDRDAIVGAGGFDTELGRRGSSLVSNEELSLMRRLRSDGGQIGYEPQAAVTHLVGSGRLRRRWLLRRAFDQGRSDAIMERLDRAGNGTSPLGDALRTALVKGWRTGVRRMGAARGARGEAVLKESVRRSRVIGYAYQRVADAALTRRRDEMPAV